MTAGVKDRTGRLVSIKKKSCPAGTLVEARVVPLAEALVSHESYQAISGAAAPSSMLPKMVKPLTTQCGYSNYWYFGWSWEGSGGTSYVSIDRYNNCNMRIDSSGIDLYYIQKYLYWNRDQYAAWTGNWGYQSLPNSWVYHYPNVVKTAGYLVRAVRLRWLQLYVVRQCVAN